MSPDTHKESTLRFYKERILRVLVYIQSHLDETIELKDLAVRAGFSQHHFHRVFRGMLGEPLMAHVRRMRLEKAANRLKNTRRSLIDLALDAGYDSHEAFTRAFKSAFGISPSRYRSQRIACEHLDARSGVHFQPEGFVANFRTLNQMSHIMNVVIESIPPARVAFIRHIGPYAECGKAWDKLCTWLGKEGLLGPGCRLIGVSYDDPEITPPHKIRYDACVTVDDTFRPVGKIGVQTIAGGEYARFTHVGSYDKLNETYGRIFGQWLPRSGHRLRKLPCFDVYLNSPENTPVSELLTDIYIPIEPR
ncbi:MAG: AraC family transcriptional regulator [Opitutaceae bacterium]|jgi:AraC family transcriptional regulator